MLQRQIDKKDGRRLSLSPKQLERQLPHRGLEERRTKEEKEEDNSVLYEDIRLTRISRKKKSRGKGDELR